MRGKGGIITGIITLVIGGTVYSVSQADIAKNLSKDTGMSQQQAEQYVNNIKEDDLVPYDKIGASFISEGQEILSGASKIDCVDYTYEWVTNLLSCEKGKAQLKTLGNSEIALGNAYTILASESASTTDISSVIKLIDKLNMDLNSEIVSKLLDYPTIDELRKTNSYNRAVLQAALDSK
jgi:hypothetical protein